MNQEILIKHEVLMTINFEIGGFSLPEGLSAFLSLTLPLKEKEEKNVKFINTNII